MDTRIRWSRLVAEGAVIVLSILLAFAIDAWWSLEGERTREEAAIAGIAQDFTRHRALLALHRDRLETRLGAAEALIGRIGPDADGGDAAVDSIMGLVGISSPVQFEGGTLETLAGTDGLALLRDEELRTALSAWRQGMDDLAGTNAFVVNEALLFLDFLRTRYPIQDMDRAAGLTAVPPSGFHASIRPILRDLEFSNLVYQQHYATTVMLSYLTFLEEIADRVLMRVEEGS